MSISPPSLWIVVGRPVYLRGLPLPCFHTKCVPIPPGLFALGGSLVSALSFVASYTLHVAHGVFVFFTLLYYVMGLRSMRHKLSSAYAEMILSYHLLPQQFFFTHNWNLSRHCCVVVCFCVVCFCLCFVFCVVFAFGSLCFGSCSSNVTR